MKVNVFISSNIGEFSDERKLIKEEISKDPILGEIFEVYLFEEERAKPDSADNRFINEVEYTDIYIGLIGSEYGEIYRKGFFLLQNMNMILTFPIKQMHIFL